MVVGEAVIIGLGLLNGCGGKKYHFRIRLECTKSIGIAAGNEEDGGFGGGQDEAFGHDVGPRLFWIGEWYGDYKCSTGGDEHIFALSHVPMECTDGFCFGILNHIKASHILKAERVHERNLPACVFDEPSLQ